MTPSDDGLGRVFRRSLSRVEEDAVSRALVELSAVLSEAADRLTEHTGTPFTADSPVDAFLGSCYLETDGDRQSDEHRCASAMFELTVADGGWNVLTALDVMCDQQPEAVHGWCFHEVLVREAVVDAPAAAVHRMVEDVRWIVDQVLQRPPGWTHVVAHDRGTGS